jgi:two-component system LytT family response regulator
MLNCIIVDDEDKSRENLRILIQDFCDNARVVAQCQGVAEALHAIDQHKPHIVFLDIQLQNETGFDLLEKLTEVDFDVIFTTAFSEYAIKAFKFSAIDYLLKPINIDELRNAIDRVEKKVNGAFSARLLNLVQNLKVGNNNKYKLAIPSSDGLVLVKVDEIIYCEASSNYTNICMLDGKKHIVSRTLKEYEDLLADQDFFRIHNSYLINLNAMKKYVRGEGGHVVMSNDVSLDVSKRKKESFLSRIATIESRSVN